MMIDDWISERERRERAYRELCREGAALVSHHESTGEDLRAVFDIVRQIDAAYLRWCETDRWEIEYDNGK